MDDALRQHGDLVRAAAVRLAPSKTGALKGAVSSTFTDGAGLVVSAGVDKAPHAYTFHATARGHANGYMVFRVPRHTRRGYQVGGYSALRRIVDNAYLDKAWEQNQTKLAESLATALGKVIDGG